MTVLPFQVDTSHSGDQLLKWAPDEKAEARSLATRAEYFTHVRFHSGRSKLKNVLGFYLPPFCPSERKWTSSPPFSSKLLLALVNNSKNVAKKILRREIKSEAIVQSSLKLFLLRVKLARFPSPAAQGWEIFGENLAWTTITTALSPRKSHPQCKFWAEMSVRGCFRRKVCVPS